LNLDVLQAGSADRGTYELLTSPRVETLIGTARTTYDYVLIDTAPLVPVPDSRLIGRCADAFLVIVAADKTPRRLLAEGLNLLDPAKVAGLVFNLDDRSSGYQNYYGYGYGRHPRRGKCTRPWWPWS
jgi:Mrp family chromosome partitioning ATPase